MSWVLPLGLCAGVAVIAWTIYERLGDRRIFASSGQRKRYRNLRSPAAREWLERHPTARILDVRPWRDFDREHLLGAENIPFPLRASSWDDPRVLGLPRDQPLLVYCSGGFRSRRAVAALRQLGFENVSNLHRGIGSWKLAGFAVDRTPTAPVNAPLPGKEF